MDPFDRLINGFTARQVGLVAKWQGHNVGVPNWAFDNRVRRGSLVVVHDGVFRHPAVAFTQETRWLAAVLAAGPEAVLSHRAAAALHHFDVRRVRPEVTAPYSRLPIVNGVNLHRSRRMARCDLVVVNRIPVTSRARTILDLAAILPYSTFEPIVEDAVIRNLLGVESLLAIVDRRGGRGVTGTVATRAALENGLVDDNIESKLELILARIIDAAAVPKPVRQYELQCADGRVVRLDNAWPDIKATAEADGRRWHGSTSQARKTRARSRSITGTGWAHYVYGWAEATETPLDVKHELETVIPRLYRAA